LQRRLWGIHQAAHRDGNGDIEAAGKHFKGWAATYQSPGTVFPDLATEKGQRVLLQAAKGKALVVIDNLTTTMRTGEENEAKYWTTMQDSLVELRKRGTAVLLVHHSNKAGDQRGTSAKRVILNGEIKLEPVDDHAPTTGAAFMIRWPKHRGLTGEDVPDMEARLGKDISGLPLWEYSRLDATRHQELIRLARSGDYGSQSELAEAMGLSRGRITQLKREAIKFGLFTAREFNGWLSDGKAAQELEPSPDF
jgi:putative DNA primase/helicase